MIRLSLSTWCDAQELVVRRLASALQVNVSAGRLAAIRRHDLGSLLAYDLWLQGQQRIHSWEPRAWAEAKQIFSDVVHTAPCLEPFGIQALGEPSSTCLKDVLRALLAHHPILSELALPNSER